MTVAAVAQIHRGGRPSSAQLTDRLNRSRLRNLDLCDELTARKAEAVALVRGLLPLVAFLTIAAREVSPSHYQAALTIAARLRRYRSQNEDPEPDGMAAAA